ncbi:MAG: proliferating cell nuclear antigen (pcna) [Candidatus Diapherotrites archaeon]|nr:proliferating cell nuclear antigen (pcna) [Candidatus Diapherotrites archaeon]
MKLVLEKAGDFKKSCEAIAVLIHEAEFDVGENGIALKATDPSQISMVDFEMKKAAFKEFKFEAAQRIGLDLDYLNQVMGRAKPTDELTIELVPQKTSLSVTFKGASTRHFSVPLIDVSKNPVPNPKIEFDVELKMKAGIVQDALKDAELISTHVLLGVEKETFFVNANSSKGTLRNETSKKEKEMKSFVAKKDCKSMFPLDYLKDMLKTPSGDDEIELKLKSDAPLFISYKIGQASIAYFLAPRIESE